EEAKAAALKHAGLAENEVKFLKAKLDKERKGLVYEVEFSSGKYEYDYEVSAENGKVLKSEKEPERVVEKPSENPVPSPEAKVSKEEAKAAALKHAGLAENEVKFLKAELDKARKGLVYEVEFSSGNYEYDYEVSAENGKVLKSEKEYRD
ncbi:MAG: PepSY domain-containing protein, partial [Clostridia bacterium]|nr:PepSY domain-containing protein [Clostridia bacterium]